MEHIWHKCDCGNPGCQFCDGGLGWCTVCGGFEGTLTTDCCGYKLDEYVLDAVYKGGLDFRESEWVVFKQECQNCIYVGNESQILEKCLSKPEWGNQCRNFHLYKWENQQISPPEFEFDQLIQGI